MTSNDAGGIRWFPVATIRAQIAAILRAWGMPADHVAITADVMVDADACGIDSHGISLLTGYDIRRREGIVTMDATISVVRESPVSALLDGGGGFGYVPAVAATNMAIEKARNMGLASVAVRNSNHFGATGYYTRMMAAHGLIGFATTNGSGPRMAPTLGKQPKLSTNPLAFAAPAKRHPAFSLDMATTTVAAGKIRVRANEGRDMPIGWAIDADGRPLTDPGRYEESPPTNESSGGRQDPGGGRQGLLTPLGGTLEGASYKGYGLSTMVEILSATLPGASLVTSDNHGFRTPGSMELGHFFLALDPTMFRAAGEFEDTVDTLIDDLHATEPIDPDAPVMVAGEPESRIREERSVTGIPVPPGLRAKLQSIATAAGAEFLLE